jgi:hypothetical protein
MSTTDTVDFRGALGTFFVAGWASTTPIAWPGRDFPRPEDGSSWVRLTIDEIDSFQTELGSVPQTEIRSPGLIIIQIFTEANKGDGPALTLADQVSAIFRKQEVSYTDGRAIFRAPRTRVIGITSEKGANSAWFQVNVSVPYIRDTWF